MIAIGKWLTFRLLEKLRSRDESEISSSLQANADVRDEMMVNEAKRAISAVARL